MAATQQNPSGPPSVNEYGGDEVSAIVLDPGFTSVRAGFAGEDIPKSVVPTFYGLKPGDADGAHPLFGDNALHAQIEGLEVKNPFAADGIVEDWDMAAQLWEYSISSRLTGPRRTAAARSKLNESKDGEDKGKGKGEGEGEGEGEGASGKDAARNGQSAAADADGDLPMKDADELEKMLADHPLLMTEPSWNTAKAREKAIEIAMERWGCPAFWMGKSGPLAAFAVGKPTALVVDVGATHTSITPVHDGFVLKKGIVRSPLGGNFISQQIRLIFAQSQPPVPLTPHFMVASKTPVDAGAPSQAILKQFKIPPTASYRLFEEERVLTEFKESVVQVWPGPGKLNASTNEDATRNSPSRPFEMPDGWNQVFGAERLRPAEGLFDVKASLFDADHPIPKPEQAITAMISESLNAVDVEIRPQLLANVVVVGSSTLLYGFTDRLSSELQALYPTPKTKVTAPGNASERKFASWIGGSILASLGNFHQLWISKREYDEHGAGVVEKRCK